MSETDSAILKRVSAAIRQVLRGTGREVVSENHAVYPSRGLLRISINIEPTGQTPVAEPTTGPDSEYMEDEG